jgi:hypothetical protein
MGAVAHMGKRGCAYTISVEKLQGMGPEGRPKSRQENIKTGLKVTQHNIMNLKLPYKMLATTFSRRVWYTKLVKETRLRKT